MAKETYRDTWDREQRSRSRSRSRSNSVDEKLKRVRGNRNDEFISSRAHSAGTRQVLQLLDQQQQQQQRSRCSLYLSNLPQTLTENELRLVFSPFGQLRALELPRHPESQRLKGFAFLEFASQTHADMAREAMDGFLLKGHELIVKSPMTEEERSLWKETRDAIARGEDRLLRLKRNRLPQEAKGLFGTAPFQKDTQEAIQASHPDDIINQGRVVRVTNLPENFSEEDVKQIMEVFGPIMAINLFSHLGEVLIHFYQKDDAAKAISTMDGFLVANKRLGVCLDKQNGQRPSSLIVLKNLLPAEEVDEQLQQEILEQCKKYGRVREVRVHIVESTKEVRVFALFTLPEEANRALRILPKRKFNKKKVECELYDYEAYKKLKFNL